MMNITLKIVGYPIYSDVVKLLDLFGNKILKLKSVNEMINIINNHTGTPQEANDWTQPDIWIDQILIGEAKDIAKDIWEIAKLNPRYISEYISFCKANNLVIESNNQYAVTSDGNVFRGESKKSKKITDNLDYSEGLYYLLTIIAEHNVSKRGDIFPKFSDFIKEHNRSQSYNTISTYWYTRMVNLTKREFISKSGNKYQITEAGLKHLESLSLKFPADTKALEPTPLISFQELILKHKAEVRGNIKKALADMDPYIFEEFIAELLEAMGYENVVITRKSRDGGIDIIAEIEVGISRVREVIQVKRYNSATVSDSVVSELRGNLGLFKAIRGTIITNGKFTKPAKERAYVDANVAPITLIDGERLIDMIIEHEIGIEVETYKVIKFNPNAFTSTVSKEDIS